MRDLIDRTYNEWLYPGGADRPAFDTLADGIDASSTTITLDGRQQFVPEDSILEIESELVLLKSSSGATSVEVQERGFLESVADSHLVGSIVYLDPSFPRIQVYNAIASVVAQLYGMGLYQIATSTNLFYTTQNTLALPTGAKDVLSVLVRSTGTSEYYYELRPGWDYTVYRQFTPPKIQFFQGGSTNAALTITYSKDFTAPQDESTDLDSSGVSPSLQPYIPMAAAGYLLQGKEFPRVMTEEIKRQLASEGIQVGSAMNVGQLLLQTFERKYVEREKLRLVDVTPPKFEWVG